MIQLLSHKSYLQMPWMNKNGVTSQILIEPAIANLKLLDFEYRLSSAPITGNTVFSKFPNYQRILITIKGKGFSLNGAVFETLEPAFFSGDEETLCELIDGNIVDLGLIYNPKTILANIKIVKFEKTFCMHKEDSSIYIIYLLRGACKVNEIAGIENDSIIITDSESLFFQCSKKAEFVLIQIKRI